MREDLLVYEKLIRHGLGYIAGQLELTSHCEQRCAFCQSWRDHIRGTQHGEFTAGKLIDILDQLADMPTFENLTFTGGEPQCWAPLESLLLAVADGLPFSLSVNTTLAQEVNPEAWHKFRAIRVSLDAVSLDGYYRTRGVALDPNEVLQRIEALAHPNWSSMTCVSKLNIDEVPELLDRLGRMKCLPRKVMLLPVLGSLGEHALDPDDFARLQSHIHRETYPFQTNLVENRNTLLDNPDLEDIPCYMGRVSFHIKANGDVYPCCLIGGEAVETQSKHCWGNIRKVSLEEIRQLHPELPCHYREGSPCRKVCQWKQTYLNVRAHTSDRFRLSMP